MQSSSYIELNQKALVSNIAFLKNHFKGVRFSSVVKSNAYGHGIDEFLKMSEECGIDHFSVFSSDEAIEVEKYLHYQADVMVMGWINYDDLDWMIKYGVEFFVFEFERLEKSIETARKLGIPAKIHVELETGMNRTGFPLKNVKKLIQTLDKNREYIRVRGLCTHYAGAESIANYYRVHDQIKVFNKVHKQFVRNNLKPEICHTACSASAISYPKTRLDMIRIGILQYGFWPSKETLIHFLKETGLKTDPLQRILSWKSSIMSIKEVKTGEFVGYGTSYLAQEDKTIAIIPIGYANGYARNLSNQGRVLIGGQRVGVIGMVNMNMLIADITSLENVNVGDEVVLIGEQGDLTISVSAFTEFSDQLNYELLTRLPDDIPRYIKN